MYVHAELQVAKQHRVCGQQIMPDEDSDLSAAARKGSCAEPYMHKFVQACMETRVKLYGKLYTHTDMCTFVAQVFTEMCTCIQGEFSSACSENKKAAAAV